MAPAKANLNLEATTPPMSALPSLFVYSWVAAEAMVVSDTGARLSPNIAPLNIAPERSAGLAPSKIPEGNKIGNAENMVPMDVPVAVAIMQVAIKVKAVKIPPFSCIRSPSQTKPPATPLCH